MLKPDPTNFKHIGISTAMSSAKIRNFVHNAILRIFVPGIA